MENCPKCHHPMYEHRESTGWGSEPYYQCWERDHPYYNGRCGCKYRPPEAKKPEPPKGRFELID